MYHKGYSSNKSRGLFHNTMEQLFSDSGLMHFNYKFDNAFLLQTSGEFIVDQCGPE
jgi:hypothetical protein